MELIDFSGRIKYFKLTEEEMTMHIWLDRI